MMTFIHRHCLTAIILIFASLVLQPQTAFGANYGPVLPQDLLLAPHGDPFYNSTGSSAVAFDGTRYLVVWSQPGAQSYDIYGGFVDTSGSFSGAPFVIANYRGAQLHPKVAYNGTHYLVVWHDNFGLYSGNAVYGKAVGVNGQLLGSEVLVRADAASPMIASDGTGFLVVFGTAAGIMGQRVSLGLSGSAVLDGTPFNITPPGDVIGNPSLAFGGSKYLVTWARDTAVNAFQHDVFGALVTSSGSVSPAIAISTASGVQGNRPAGIGFDGTNFLVAFSDVRNGGMISGARVSEVGGLLDGPASSEGIT